MKIEVNAVGLACPMPVIKTKKQLENIENGVVITIVDNDIAKENILKLAKSMNLEANSYEKEGNFYIQISKELDRINTSVIENNNDLSNEMILIKSEFMGHGNDELGKVLMKGFIYTISESKPYPKCIALINSAVKLSSENEETIQSLKSLQSDGCEIISCGTCLDYYNLKDDLKVGIISNMYDIVDKMKSSEKVITI